jgi:hypothetical protein
MRMARLSSVLTGSDWRPERGDIVHAVDPSAPVYHYEHPFTPDEIEGEARAAGLSMTHHGAFPANPVAVLVRGGTQRSAKPSGERPTLG